MKPELFTLFSGGAKGSETEFGIQAETHGLEEVHFTFDGHPIRRKRGVRFLTQEELAQGDVSLSYISKIMNRSYKAGPILKKVMQTIWHQINHAEEVFIVGWILEDNTVKGGTGWGAEFAKLCNKSLHVFDQDRNRWFKWSGEKWKEEAYPKIRKKHFAGSGTRNLNAKGKRAIADLFANSFSK
tara:strand:- start:2279 stop:2830 length:552 start_codon:yes stop_codon:yes gene_type:complete